MEWTDEVQEVPEMLRIALYVKRSKKKKERRSKRRKWGGEEFPIGTMKQLLRVLSFRKCGCE